MLFVISKRIRENKLRCVFTVFSLSSVTLPKHRTEWSKQINITKFSTKIQYSISTRSWDIRVSRTTLFFSKYLVYISHG